MLERDYSAQRQPRGLPTSVSPTALPFAPGAIALRGPGRLTFLADVPDLASLEEFQLPHQQPGWADLDAFLASCEPPLREHLALRLVTLENGFAHVAGGVNLWRKPLSSLPGHLWVDRDLDLEGTGIEQLSECTRVGGDLNLGSMTSELAPDLLVEGDLNLMYSKVYRFPEKLTVLGDLCVELSPMAGLPDSVIRAQADIRGAIYR